MKIAVITGASSGMGQEFAAQINQKCLGLDEIWLIARRKELMEEGAKELTLPVRVFAMDLSDDPSYAELIYALETEKPQVRVAVNCAGYGKTGPFSDISIEDNLGMIDVNCRALTKMSCLLLPYMPQRSYLIQVASVAGILPQPNFAVYAASKAYVLSLSRALREELRPKGISVTAVCPGPVATDFFAIAEETGSPFALKKYFMAKKEKVVALALKDAFRKKDVSVYGISMKALRLLVKTVPQKMILYVYAKLYRNVS
ncbi:MAG: SDR family NAD(P)-dependent oxidoreductase [Lachnospiraceae bacterium]|nr:SDR family NAD(P)-dependent oxidoreductase [Lachnospiraceae bacterium]